MNRNGTIQNVLTRGSIRKIMELTPDRTTVHPLDCVLQVLVSKRKEEATQRQNNPVPVFTCTLSDGEHKYTGFVIFVNDPNLELRQNDIVKVENVIVNLINNKNKICIIKKIELLERGVSQIGIPELLKEESLSKERTSSMSNNGNQSNINNNVNINNVSHINSNLYNQGRNNYNDNNNNDNSHSHNQARKNFYHPLSSLTTFSKDILLLVRVTKKAEKKSFTSRNSSGTQGSLFSFTLMDEDGVEMQATCFNKAVDKFYDIIHENSVYEIQGGYVKVNDKKFSNLKSEYKLTFDENCTITEKEDDGGIKEMSFDFIKIADIGTLQIHSVVDVFAYVLEVNDKVTKSTKYKGDQLMRKIILCDESEYKSEFTLWRDQAELEFRVGNVISVKNAKVGDFNGRNLSSIDDTRIVIEPPIKEVSNLKHFCSNYSDWKTFTSQNSNSSNDSSSNSATLNYIKDCLAVLDSGEPDDRIQVSKVKATICTINHSEKNFYPGCPDKNCKKKLVQDTYNWHCHNCNKNYPSPTYYYTLSFRIKDATAEFWVDLFGDVGQKLLKMTCEEYKDLVVNRDDIKLKQLTQQLEFQSYLFVVKPKMQIYQNVPKKRLNVFRIELVDCVAEMRKSVKNIMDLLSIRK